MTPDLNGAPTDGLTRNSCRVFVIDAHCTPTRLTRTYTAIEFTQNHQRISNNIISINLFIFELVLIFVLLYFISIQRKMENDISICCMTCLYTTNFNADIMMLCARVSRGKSLQLMRLFMPHTVRRRISTYDLWNSEVQLPAIRRHNGFHQPLLSVWRTV